MTKGPLKLAIFTDFDGTICLQVFYFIFLNISLIVFRINNLVYLGYWCSFN